MPEDSKGSLAELLSGAFDEVFTAVKERLASKEFYVQKYTNYPVMKLRENGIPYFDTMLLYSENARQIVTSVVGGGGLLGALVGGPSTKFNSPKCDALADELLNSPSFKSRFEDNYPNFLEYGRYDILSIIRECVERYNLKYGMDEIVVEKRKRILIPIYRWLLVENLPVSIVIPVILNKFELDHFRLTDDAFVMRMTKPLQLARSRIHDASTGVNPSASGAATHALVIRGWSLPNQPRNQIEESLRAIPEGVRNIAENFFAALQMVTKQPTGYSQVIYWPVGWATGYYADLPRVFGTSVRKYPRSFDHYNWYAYSKVEVSRSEIEKVVRLFRALESRNETSLKIAVRRLNSCHNREDTVDAIIDGCIGLEVLLSDGKEAIAYKLRMRAGALAGVTGNGKPNDVSKRIGKLYDARSSIVHGSRKFAKEFDKDEDKYEEIRDIASAELSNVIDAVLRHPKFLKPAFIDSELLLGAEVGSEESNSATASASNQPSD